MLAHRTRRILTPLVAAISLCVQTVASLPVACNCTSQRLSEASRSTNCCQAATHRHDSARGLVPRKCCNYGVCGCRHNGQNTTTTGCRCSSGHDSPEPYKPVGKNESSRDSLQQLVSVASFVVLFKPNTSPVIAVLDPTLTILDASPSVQIRFCIWLT